MIFIFHIPRENILKFCLRNEQISTSYLDILIDWMDCIVSKVYIIFIFHKRRQILVEQILREIKHQYGGLLNTMSHIWRSTCPRWLREHYEDKHGHL